jgi:hypothetical protein
VHVVDLDDDRRNDEVRERVRQRRDHESDRRRWIDDDLAVARDDFNLAAGKRQVEIRDWLADLGRRVRYVRRHGADLERALLASALFDDAHRIGATVAIEIDGICSTKSVVAVASEAIVRAMLAWAT